MSNRAKCYKSFLNHKILARIAYLHIYNATVMHPFVNQNHSLIIAEEALLKCISNSDISICI